MTITLSNPTSGGTVRVDTSTGKISVSGTAFDGLQPASSVCVKIYPAETVLTTIPVSAPADAKCAAGGSTNFNVSQVPGAACALPPLPAKANLLAVWADFGGATPERAIVTFAGECAAAPIPGGTVGASEPADNNACS